MKRILACLSLSLLGACATTSNAATAPVVETAPATPLDMRSNQLIAMLNGAVPVEDYFTASFLTAVPPAQINAISESLLAQYGKAVQILSIDRKGPNSAVLKVDFERAIGTVEITVEPSAPNKVAGLLATGFAVKGDDIAKISGDFKALPGRAGYLVQRLDGTMSTELSANEQYATGSTFKLYVLAELASQIEAGRRKWSDVVPLDARAFSSSATQGWPHGTPVTLQTLATWMISVSDNAATDELIRVLGRDAVEQKLATIGHSAPDKALPLLTTVEAFALKSNPTLRTRFERASEEQQRDILVKEAAALGYDRIDLSQLGSGPVAINSIEWFASPADIALLMEHLRRIDSKAALDIMAVNKGVAPASATKWQYLGYKGGSEPGVISMSFLAQSKAGDWYAISGSWNNPAAEVDNAAFAALMTRLLDNVAG
jgi:Beta-lactamase enzyme family